MENNPTTESSAPLKPATRDLINAILLDVWPHAGTIVDFGLDSQEHYEAVSAAYSYGDITPEALDAALGDGPKLTELLRSSPNNPHKDIEFSTSWDVIRQARAASLTDDLGPQPSIEQPESTIGLRVETPQERDGRYQFLLFNGAPLPKGWDLPLWLDPPERTDPEALKRAVAQIETLKTIELESWRRVPFDSGVAVEPGKTGRWDDLTEFGKLDLMQHWVDWQGIGARDKAATMAAPLDLERLSPQIREELMNNAGLTGKEASPALELQGALARRGEEDGPALIPVTQARTVLSPSAIADSKPQQGAPDQERDHDRER